MEWLAWILQVTVAFGIFNVWLLRFGQSTAWRGGSASNMREEFEIYGLPGWVMIAVGSLKVLCAAALLAGLVVPALTLPAAVALGALMLGAVAMHFKVGDPPKKALPAISMLVMCVAIAALALR